MPHFFIFSLLAVLANGPAEPAGPLPSNGIAGTVRDTSGAVVPQARLLLRGPIDREATSDGDGAYSIQGIRVGQYLLVVEKAGFELAQTNVTISATQVTQDVALQPAPVRQTIEVVDTADIAALAILKMAGSLHETPRSVTAFSAGELRERNVRNIPELLATVPGMSPNSYRTGGYHFYARGFRMLPEDTRVDGFPGINLGGGYGASLFGVEEAVMLRGPAGLLYGATGSPGGLINLVTKRPQPVRATRLDLRAGGYQGNGVALSQRPSVSFDFDSTGAVLRNERILYRALFTSENNSYFTANVRDRNRFANGALTFRLDRLGLYTITPMFQYGKMVRPTGGGVVISPSTSLSVSDGISGPIHENDLSPLDVNLSAGLQNYYSSQAGFDFRAVPTARWNFNLAYRYFRNDRHINQWTPQVSTAAQIALLTTRDEVMRAQSKSDTQNRYQNLDANTSYELRGNGWKSSMQIGAYTRVTGVRATVPLGVVPAAAFPINIYTGAGPQPIQDVYPALAFGGRALTTNWNGYFQNRTLLLNDRLILALGLGYGQSHPGGAAVRKGEVMPNYSALFNVTRALALFGSYSTSFNPVDPTLENLAGVRGGFAPTTGKNYEAGAKFDSLNRRVSATVSYFRNSISNALVQTGINDLNPNGLRYYVEAGSRRGKGVEWTSDLHLTRDVLFRGTVSYTDSIYTGSGPASAASTLAIPGSKAEKTPKWAWTARTDYQRSEGRLSGLGAGFALLWQDQRLGSNGARTFAAPDPLMLPAYLRVDAAISYRLNRHLDWSLNVENLTDRRIFVNATTGASIEIAPPRTATIRMSYRF
ncbi:MAG TPA: TonB-dependent receptor [Paludibaculum sp.]|jgi:iron complex outermembrane receptor protein